MYILELQLTNYNTSSKKIPGIEGMVMVVEADNIMPQGKK